jgi:hypothetical protein
MAEGLPAKSNLSRLEIAILGELRMRRDGRELANPTNRPATVLVILALASEPVPVSRLCRMLDSKQNAVEQQVSALRNGHDIPVKTSGQRGKAQYSLDRGCCQVDALTFAEGVGGLSEHPEAAAIDELLGLWRGDPRTEHREVPVDEWDEIFDARNRLIRAIERLSLQRRESLSGLARFTGYFPNDLRVHPIRPRAEGIGRRKRLLIVEDEVVETIVGLLEDDYECVPIVSFKDWNRFKKVELRESQVDGALIDLHLEGTDDALGMEIVKYLQFHTDIPAAVVTSNADAHTVSKKNRMLVEYRLVEIVDKDDRRRYLRSIPEVAELLVGDDEHSRRRRMETFVRAALHQEERETAESGRGSVTESRLAECRKEAETAERLIWEGAVDEVQRVVDAFLRRWAPRR